KFYFNGIKYQEDLPRPFSIWIDEIEFYYEPEVITVTAPQEAVSAAPGEGVHFPVTIRNLDEEVLPIEMTLSPYRFLRDARTDAIVYEVHYDWSPRLYLDENRDGRLQSTETTEVTRYRLSPGETLHAVVVDHVPDDIPPGTRHETSLVVKVPGTTQVAGAQLFTRITESPESGGETAPEEESGGEGGGTSAFTPDEEEETAGTTGEGDLPDPEGSSDVTLAISGAIDTTLDEKYPDLDRSARTDASISAKGGERKHVLLRFPIFTREGGPLPEDAVIESARLELSFYGVGSQIPGSGGTVRVHSLRRAFDAAGGATWNVAEAGVAWQRPGALGEELDYDPRPLDEIVIPDGTGTYPLDVTPAIEAWSEETGENPGFLLLPGPNARIHPYHGGGFLFTAENADDPHYARFLPRLMVTYHRASGGGGTPEPEETSRCALETIRLDDAEDTTLDEKYPDYSHGTRLSGFVSGFPGEAKHYLIHFPIFAWEGGPLPEGAEIESARLELSFYGVGSRIPGSGGTIEAYRLLKGWRAGSAPDGSGENAEGEATWRFAEFPGIPWDLPGAQGAGSDYDPTLLDAAVISDGTGTYTLDITPALREWAQGRAPNHGVILFPADGAQNDPYHGGGFLFTAENAGDPDYARFTPTLTIEYRDCP
ncbi:MAG: DNRLRE domain-containing protein, partial [Deltaproteobacteria bacterium]